MEHEFQVDIDAIGRIDAVPTILDVVCRATGMRFAAVARVTEGRWITCSVLDNIDFGLVPGDELKVETTICHEIRQSREPVVINHVAEDDTYSNHPTPAMYGFQSYISMPIIRKNGEFFGTLCAIDPAPARIENPETVGMFKLFAELIAAHLDADDQLFRARLELDAERERSELREQFIAVLGHDLRNPIAAVQAGTQRLVKLVPDEHRATLALMQGSLLRMQGLISNVMDFASARLGDGLKLNVDAQEPVGTVLQQVVDEMRVIVPGRNIEADFALTERVACDPARIAQLLSNLLSNALTHGAPHAPVRVGATTRDGYFELWVSNAGAPIPDHVRGTLFQPFVRGAVSPTQQGLGLGLFIAAEIARVHGGTLEAASGDGETRFMFRMPTDNVATSQ